MLVTVVVPPWESRPMDDANVRSPMSTVNFDGSMRSFLKLVRTFVPGDAPPAVYCEKFAPLVSARSMYSRGVVAMS
jgi:hypothetical protein